MTNYSERDFYREFGDLGIEVLKMERAARGVHIKIHCRYLGHKFTYLTSKNTSESDRGVLNRTQDLKRIKRAIRARNQTILDKYKVARDE